MTSGRILIRDFSLQAELARLKREMAEREEQRQAKMLQERVASSLSAGQSAAQSVQLNDQLQRTIKVCCSFFLLCEIHAPQRMQSGNYFAWKIPARSHRRCLSPQLLYLLPFAATMHFMTLANIVMMGSSCGCLQVSWDPSIGTYSNVELRAIFEEHGLVEDVIPRPAKKKSKASALIVMTSMEVCSKPALTPQTAATV